LLGGQRFVIDDGSGDRIVDPIDAHFSSATGRAGPDARKHSAFSRASAHEPAPYASCRKVADGAEPAKPEPGTLAETAERSEPSRAASDRAAPEPGYCTETGRARDAQRLASE
jgi:hypothetical protein